MKICRYLLTMLLISSLLYSGCTSYHIDQPEITVEELQETIGFLASDSLKGRYPGTTEDSIMADWLVKKFREMGIKMMAEEGQQYFEIVTNIKAGDNNLLTFNDSTFEQNKEAELLKLKLCSWDMALRLMKTI